MMKDIMVGSKTHPKIKGFAEVLCLVIFLAHGTDNIMYIAHENYLWPYNIFLS